MASSASVRSFFHNKVLPCIRKKYPNVCMTSVPHLNGSRTMEIRLSVEIPEFDFKSNVNQTMIEAMARTLERKTGLEIHTILSGFWVVCDD